MFNKDVLALLKDDVGEDVLAHLFLLFREELEAQHKQLERYPFDVNREGVRDILHILKNTSRLYGVNALNEVADALYQHDVIDPTDIERLCCIISDTIAAIPISQEAE